MESLREIQEYLENFHPDEDITLFDNYDYCTAFIGVTNASQAVYDYDKMIEYLIQKENMSVESAIEWIDYNTIRALSYCSEDNPPIILYSVADIQIF